MSTRSTGVYEMWGESAEKYDYFVCGVSGALFAYIGQNYIPQKIGFNASTIELASLALFALSFFSGLKRLEFGHAAKRMNYAMLDAAEKAGAMTKTLAQPVVSGQYFNAESGECFNRDQVEEKRNHYMTEVKKCESMLQSLKPKGVRYYKARDIFLLVGFIAIIAAKMLQPY